MNKEWFYFFSDIQYGPISDEELKNKFLERTLSLDALVWRYGMEEWQRADEVEDFSKLQFLPPPLPQNIPRENIVDVNPELIQPPPLPKNSAKSVIPKFLMDDPETPSKDYVPSLLSSTAVRPWCRYWARMLDFNFYLLAGSIFMVLTIAGFGGSQTGLTIGTFIWLSILLGGWIFLETALLSSIGTTLGKWLFNIRVRNSDGSILSYKQALKRTAHVWLSGEGLCIPIISLFANFESFKRLTSTGNTVWDESGGYQVSTKKLGTVRITFTLIVASVLLHLFRQAVFHIGR